MNTEQIVAVQTVIATLNGNTDGLSTGDQLLALRMACELLAEAFPHMGGDDD